MSGKQSRPTTLGDLVRKITNVEPPRPAPDSAPKPKKGEIVSPRDEHGLPYHGDFPNPASDRNRGCF